jgi:hypothetical protein
MIAVPGDQGHAREVAPFRVYHTGKTAASEDEGGTGSRTTGGSVNRCSHSRERFSNV